MAGSIRRVFERVREEGLRRAIARAWDRIVDRWNDWRLGIRSSGYITTSELGIDDPGCNDYEPTHYADIRRILRGLAIEPGRDVLLDYGAGMGRMMVAAAEYPFRKIVGVELAAQLSALGRENLARRRSRFRCHDLELITADACLFVVPSEVTVVYIFNSFGGEVLASVLDRIRESVEQTPRRLRLAFCAPPNVIGDPLAGCDWLVRRRVEKGATDKRIYFYETAGQR